ncbi:MAG: Asp-tRNA(Asn)/Glu-tRNA(Gln) amidotransferase subunit GatB [Frankiaceae bacterium]|nr:Asp-tRNA(Asn)/Glu-tRNA(Gln) amidotransferase subunit GatB [Frankiaceae bacterium]MBV9870970.1 Asp-tRNA(Asn)/Glu-tRNA(Gln) amidotransferase subunit GatB [Frankiaceae bacterium]
MTTVTTSRYDDVLERYDAVLGLETHVELGTVTKLFCGCSTAFGAEPNSQVCPTCLGLPGSLPVTNGTAIDYSIKIGLALHCDIADWCRFARKNYFYPDMPKDYQTSQYDEPLCTDGYLDVTVDGETFRVEIERVHLEEDTGKSLHVGGATGRIHGATHSLVDYNRAGIPLVEIVTRPVRGTGHKAAEVARAYVTELRDILRDLGVSDVRMEQGSLRCDVNLSLMPKGATELGTRTETKNVNSLRSVEQAVRHEVERQAALLDAGERIVQETRHFHEDTGTTSPGRSKEEAQDYRYFPEPDLVPLAPPAEQVEAIRASLPEPPSVRRARFAGANGFTAVDIDQMTNAGVIDLVASTIDGGASPTKAKGWWLGYLVGRANELGEEVTELAIGPAEVVRISALEDDGSLTNKLARQVADAVLAGEGGVDEVIDAHGWKVAGEDELIAAIDAVIADNADTADKVRGGNLGAVGPLVGAVMKATGGAADAKRARELILEKLGQS